MRLFTAVWLPPEAGAALASALQGVEPPGWRRVDPATWHVTLAFHGEADPGPLARRLDASARGMPGPRLRVAGAGAFPSVQWAGIEPRGALLALVRAAGGDGGRFVPHVTVLRRRSRPGAGADPEPPLPWSTHEGPWWRAAEALLVASEPARGGVRYRPVHRVPLAAPAVP